MRKRITVFFVSACLLLLPACGREEQPSASGGGQGDYEDGQAGNGGNGGSALLDGGGSGETGGSASQDGGAGSDKPSGDEEGVTRRFRIVDGAQSGSLVLAPQEGYDISTLFTGDIPVYVNGGKADASALEDGMVVDVAFDGNMMETFPLQFGQVYSISAYGPGTEENPGGGYYDICGLYLQVLDDLWDRDSGLNGGIRMVSVDLSQAPGGLTEGEKAAIAWIFACRHNVEMLTLTYEELIREGYLTQVELENETSLYQWEDGLLFSITATEWEENEVYSLPAVKFDAEKWRSPLGAYIFGNCSALWPESGTWSGYEIGLEAIS